MAPFGGRTWWLPAVGQLLQAENRAADPYDLGGEIEIWLEDEKHIIDRSALIFVPAGMVHCPLVITRVDRPIFHFTIVRGHQYEKLREGTPAHSGGRHAGR